MGVGATHKPLEIEKLEQLYAEISALSVSDRIYKLKLNPDRADVIDHAATIYLSIMKWAHISQIYSPNAGLKDGLIIDLWDRYKDVVR